MYERTYLLGALLLVVGCGARTELSLPQPSDQPVTTCSGSLSAPTQIASLDVPAYEFPLGLVVVGSYAYVGFSDGESGGELLRVSLADGSADVLSPAYDFGPLVADAQHLYFPPPIPMGNLTAHTVVDSYDVSTLAVNTLPMPPAPPGDYDVTGLATSPAGIWWLASLETAGGDAESSLLALWDGVHSRTISTLPTFGSDVVLGSTDAFVLGGTAVGQHFQQEGLYRVPLSGDSPTLMKSLVTYESPSLIGTVGNDVIYSPDSVSIVRAGASGEKTLVKEAYPNQCGSDIPFCQHRAVWLDDQWIYYISMGVIHRVDLQGEKQETFVTVADGAARAVTSDADNVYWVETRTPSADAKPPALYKKCR